MEDLIGTQQHIRLCYFNLVRMKREKLELQLKLLREKNEIDEKINKCIEEVIGMDEEISSLRKGCCHPDHDKGDGCPDCGSPF